MTQAWGERWPTTSSRLCGLIGMTFCPVRSRPELIGSSVDLIHCRLNQPFDLGVDRRRPRTPPDVGLTPSERVAPIPRYTDEYAERPNGISAIWPHEPERFRNWFWLLGNQW